MRKAAAHAVTTSHIRPAVLRRRASCVARGTLLAKRIRQSPVQILHTVTNGPDPCSYLGGQFAAMQYAQIGAMHPDATRFAMIRRRAGKWELVVRGLSGDAMAAAITFDGIVAQPAWSRDGRALFATVARDGFIEISRFDYDPAAGTLSERGQVTRGAGASFAPAVSEDALWFLSLDPDGLDLRRLPLTTAEQATQLGTLLLGGACRRRSETQELVGRGARDAVASLLADCRRSRATRRPDGASAERGRRRSWIPAARGD